MKTAVLAVFTSAYLALVVFGAEEGLAPVIRGGLANKFGEADVAACVCLARQINPGLLGQPMLICTETTRSPAGQPEFWSATLYFPPRETNERCWRGFYLHCYWQKQWEQTISRDDEPTRRVVGGWSVDRAAHLNEYLVLSAQGQVMPGWPTDHPESLRYICLRSPLPTEQLLDCLETSLGYSTTAKDGSELRLNDLPVQGLSTSTNDNGQTFGSMEVYIPKGLLKSSFPMYVKTVRDPKHGWRIVKVEQYVY